MLKIRGITAKTSRHPGARQGKMHKTQSRSFFFSRTSSIRFVMSRCMGRPFLVLALVTLVGGFGTRLYADSAPNFNTQVAPILQKNCLACHSSAAKMGGLVMENFDALMKGGAHGAAIVPGKPDQSRLIEMLEGKVQPRMPFGGDPLPAADIATLKAWVESGALGPAPGETAKALAPLPIPDIKPQVSVVSPVASLKFSPDGKLLAVGGYQVVRLFDSATGKPLATLSGHADYVRSIAFSPDRKKAARSGRATRPPRIFPL